MSRLPWWINPGQDNLADMGHPTLQCFGSMMKKPMAYCDHLFPDEATFQQWVNIWKATDIAQNMISKDFAERIGPKSPDLDSFEGCAVTLASKSACWFQAIFLPPCPTWGGIVTTDWLNDFSSTSSAAVLQPPRCFVQRWPPQNPVVSVSERPRDQINNGWWFGTFFIFPDIGIIIPTD